MQPVASVLSELCDRVTVATFAVLRMTRARLTRLFAQAGLWNLWLPAPLASQLGWLVEAARAGEAGFEAGEAEVLLGPGLSNLE